MKFAHQSATIRQHGKGMIILETALETAGLTYVFPDGNGIKNIAFQVKRGEIYALYGGHHAGKSVLLQTIIGTLRSQAGTLKLFGNIDYQKERRRIGFVPQKPVTIGSLSPADMLRYFSSVFGTTEIHILDILHLNLKEKKAVRRLPLSTQRLVNLAVALLGNPDMIILDLGLPDIDGLEVIEKIKENLNIKIIVVSAREHERQKVDALDKGADDYLTKPFSIPELLVRIRVAFRNKSDKQDKSENIEFYEFNGLKVDYEKRQVLVDNVEIKLTPIEYKLVELLSKHSGRVLTHKFLIKETWGIYLESDNQTLRVFMANIRKKIESDTTNPKYIVTEVGVGYRLKSE